MNIENINELKSLKKCKDIKQEILKFGVSETEIKKLIELLSLELEDTNLSRRIFNEINKKTNLSLGG